MSDSEGSGLEQPPFISVRQGLEPYSFEPMRADDLSSWSSSSTTTGSSSSSDSDSCNVSDADDVYDGPAPMLGIVGFATVICQ